jgi:hypothetical protein
MTLEGTLSSIWSEAFAATGFNKVFLGNQQRQVYKINRRFEDDLGPHHQGCDMIPEPHGASYIMILRTFVIILDGQYDYIYEAQWSSGIILHPSWWGSRWSSKRRFLLYIWRGWVPEKALLKLIWYLVTLCHRPWVCRQRLTSAVRQSKWDLKWKKWQ